MVSDYSDQIINLFEVDLGSGSNGTPNSHGEFSL